MNWNGMLRKVPYPFFRLQTRNSKKMNPTENPGEKNFTSEGAMLGWELVGVPDGVPEGV